MNMKLPKLKQGLTFYCESGCYKNKKLLKGENAKRYFFDAIKSCQKQHTFKLLAAKMEPNGIHLLIKTIEGEESIMVIMFYIMDMIEEMYNKDTGRSDSIWDDINRMSIIDEAKDPKQ
jgi:REP element-mobilizing transposase RayT